ncbi:hypothetical protein BDP27DRAFT_1412831 [Rhodocollybia butyracea]|uniref:Uncharacterized protein n=1 Tax=Rhodocollybia butyracea TaxID=206335 RepID=A0A9P5Q3U9_9AGAR|nr:hypothetical protein BDP27DRAFT_1412831 [Rhodocollybia butyracea]
MSYNPERERFGTHSPPPEKQQGPPYGRQRGYAPRPTATRAPASAPPQSSFFSNARDFDISGGKFSNIAGDLNETTNNDYSAKSNFDNDYQGSNNFNDRAVHNDYESSTNSHYSGQRGMPVRGRGRQHYPQDRGYAPRRPGFRDDDNWDGYDDQDEMDERDFDGYGSYYDEFPARHGPGYGQTPRDGGRYAFNQPWQRQDPTESRTRAGGLQPPPSAPELTPEKQQMISKLLQFLDSRKDAALLLNAFFTERVSSEKKNVASDDSD